MYRMLFKQFNGTIPVMEEIWDLSEEKEQERYLDQFPCRISCRKLEDEQGKHFIICAEALDSMETPVSLSLEYVKKDWKKTEYVFMPAAAYNGNKMESKKLPYPPYYAGKTEEGWKEVITDIPHLEQSGKDSAIQFLSGDMSTPAMGYFDETSREGILIMARHMAADRYTGFSIRQKGDQAEFCVSCPGVREGKKYFFGELPQGGGFYPTCEMPSDDTGIALRTGEVLKLEVTCRKTAAENLNAYFAEFNEVRESLEKGVEFSSIPFSKAYDAVREKYVKMNFTEEGYFRVGTENEVPPSFWQAGWVGGGINSYPFLLEDDGIAREQAMSTLNFIVKRLQRENGWYLPMYAEGKAYGDDFLNEESSVLLVRKDMDLLYFLLKQTLYLKNHKELPEGLEDSIRAQADAIVRFYEKNGELGQFIDMETETLAEGGTAGAAIASAALALSYEYFGEKEYLKTAEALGELYRNRYLKRGILNGGPGEICQAPDSESAFGFLESCVQLYETTGKDRWLEAAKDAFELAITWVVSYDFTFPKESTAKKIGAHTRGTVFANAQNKHSAPGICTLSGNSMLKLYRFTGDEKYLEWMSRISHALSQFVSLEDRPVETLAGKPLLPGYFNERVQTSDWEGKHTVGEFLYGSNWPEVTMLLTYVEIPGIYVDLDRDRIKCSDHVTAELAGREENKVILRLNNRTRYDAVVTILADHSKNADKLGHLYYERMEKISVKAGTERVISIEAE